MEGSKELRSMLLSSGCATFSTTPAFVRQLFKRLASPAPGRLAARGVGSGAVGANGTASLRSGNPSARSTCILVLRYCLEDLGPGRGSNGPENGPRRGGGKAGIGGRNKGRPAGYGELAGLPLVPLADGSHGVFRSFAAVDAQKLELIRGMGFSEAKARQALVKHKEVQAAVEWLSGGGADGDDTGGDVPEQPFVLCSEEESLLLAGAGANLISEASLSSAGGKGGTTAAGRAKTTGEDDGRVLRALRSPALQSALNVTTMRDDLLPDLIGQTFPTEWRGAGAAGGGSSSTAFPWTPGKSGHPDVDWFRRLWGYLASSRPTAVRLLAESYPVVPTGNSVVCPLSLRSAVIDGGGLGKDVRNILVGAGCRTLLPGVFARSVGDAAAAVAAREPKPATAGGAKPATSEAQQEADAAAPGAAQRRPLPPPPVELFEYVRPGMREGVLAALGTARRSAGRPLKDLMRAAGPAERDALREFLAREPASEMSKVEVDVCRELPILPLHEDGLVAARVIARAEITAAAAAAAGGGAAAAPNTGSGSTPPPGSGQASDGGTYAAANAAPLYLLLETGNGFVGVGSKEEDTTDAATAATEPAQKWLETHLLTPSFVRVPGGGAEAKLLEVLGARLVGRAVFFVEHVFPRIEELPNGLRDAAMVEALLAAPRLSQQHGRFRTALAELEFVPTTSKVSGVF